MCWEVRTACVSLLVFHELIVCYFFHPLKPQDLKDFMRQAGEITFADAHKQRVGEG